MRRAGKVAPPLVLFNLGLALAGTAEAAPPVAPTDARGSLALYCAEECGELALTDFALRARLPLTAARPVVLLSDVTDTWARPAGDRLAQWGEGEVDGMAAAQEIVLLQWAVPLQDGASALSSLAEAAARAASWVEDVDTGRLMDATTAGQLAADAGADVVDVARLIVVEVHDGGDAGATLVTAGLRRLGLPELVDTGVPVEQIGARAARLNAIAQAVFEDGLAGTVEVDAHRFASAGARRSACGLTGTAHLAALDDRGVASDPGPRALVVDFQGESGDCSGEGGAALAADSAPTGASAGAAPTAGSEATAAPAPVAPAPLSPPDSLEAVQRAALARLAGPVHDAFVAGLPPGDRLMVKAPFRSPGGRVAWLWLEVDRWSAEGVLSGPLLSEPPDGMDLQPGATVQAPLDVVFDYIWQHADGRVEGNTTQRFL